MARVVFLSFICAILILCFISINLMVKVTNKRTQLIHQSQIIDSLVSENTALEIEAGRLQFIIDQVKELHPKEIEKIESDTE